jgi:hypothetical protein
MSQITISLEERLRQAHADLLADLHQLGSATAEMGLASLRTNLLKARQDLVNHFRLEEENGYLEEVRKREPCLEQTLLKLAGEHRKLLSKLDDILARLEYPQPVLDELQRQVRLWVHDVRGHEIRENDLIQDAFVHDLGVGD